MAQTRDGTAVSPLYDEEGRQVVITDSGNPLQVEVPAGVLLPVEIKGSAQTAPAKMSSAANTVAITASSVVYALPNPGAYYYLIASGGTAYLLTGDGTQTATTTAASGFGCVVPEGQVLGPMRIKGPTVAVIGTVAAGSLTFLCLDPALQV